MQNKDTLRNLLFAGAVFVVIMAVAPALLPKSPAPSQVPTTPPASAPSEVVPSSTVGVGSVEGSVEAVPKPSSRSLWSVVEAAESVTPSIGANLDAAAGFDPRREPYRMQLVLSNVGAGVDSALLTDHAAHVKRPQRYQFLRPSVHGDGRVQRSLTVDKINIDGNDIELSDKKWHLDGVQPYHEAGQEGQSASFHLDVHKADQPIVRIVRTWRLPQQAEALGRHDLFSGLQVVNLTAEPHRVVLTVRGGLGISQDRARDDRVVDTGVQIAPGRVTGTRKLQADVVRAGKPITLFTPNPAQPDQRLLWAATGNTYFTCTLAPLSADGKGPAASLAEIAAFDADGDAATTDDATFRVVTSLATVPPQGTIAFPSALFIGEKDARAFRAQPDYRERDYYYQISQGFGWCTFNFLVEVMIGLLNTLFFVLRDFGLAIICLVLIVRALLHPLTKKGQVSMAKMQRRMTEMAPKIEEIKRKFANDKVRMNQEMMKLNINPAGQLMTCLPMFIQMPIWVALFLSLSNNILMRHQPLHFTWISDLTAPDAMIPFSSIFVIPLFGWRVESFNLLPLLVSVFMYLQQKTAPKPPTNPNMSDEQRQQQEMMQKMMPMMSIMMLLIFYNMPAGLNLYIMFSSLFGWLEQMVIRKHIKQQEADGTLFASPKKPDDRLDDKDRKPGKPSFFERIQKMAADAQKAQRTQRAPKPRR